MATSRLAEREAAEEGQLPFKMGVGTHTAYVPEQGDPTAWTRLSASERAPVHRSSDLTTGRRVAKKTAKGGSD